MCLFKMILKGVVNRGDLFCKKGVWCGGFGKESFFWGLIFNVSFYLLVILWLVFVFVMDGD